MKEKFYLEEPSIERKADAIDYIEEHFKYNSNINGANGLKRYLENYSGWLDKLNEDKNRIVSEEKVPARTYFLIRKNDNKIIGMINIRLCLTKELLQHGGHIGYGIRPVERGKGYNKINLFLGLKKCQEFGLEKVLLTATDINPASYKTIISLGGVLENKIPDDEESVMLGRYWIDVNASIKSNEKLYLDKIVWDSNNNKKI